MFAFQYFKVNSEEICKEISFPSFFRKMLMSAFQICPGLNDKHKKSPNTDNSVKDEVI